MRTRLFGKPGRLPMVFAVAGLLAGCTAMENYLSGKTFSGESIVKTGLLVIENLTGEPVLQIWTREGEMSDWRHRAGMDPLLGVPIIAPGESYRMRLLEGANDVRLVGSSGAEVTKRIYMTPAGARWTIEPERKPAPVASAPAVPPASPAAPSAAPKPAATSAPAGEGVAIDALEGTYATAKKTHPHYGNREWKTLEFISGNRVTWTWMNDFSNSTAITANDTCFWEADKYQLSYTRKSEDTFELRCVDKKQMFCDGEVRQRGCFSHSLLLRNTAEGIRVKIGGSNDLYTKQ